MVALMRDKPHVTHLSSVIEINTKYRKLSCPQLFHSSSQTLRYETGMLGILLSSEQNFLPILRLRLEFISPTKYEA